jgi:hypothetical protein
LKESGVDFEAVGYKLCRYITRPAIANEGLKRNRAGQVMLQLKSPYKDCTTHIVMEPLEFMERLAARVPWMTARPKSWLGQSATSSTRANACAFFALPDALDATTVIYVLIAAG